MSKTGKKSTGRKKKNLSINKLNDDERDFYQDVMESLLRDNGVDPKTVMDKVKEKYKKKKNNKVAKKNLRPTIIIKSFGISKSTWYDNIKKNKKVKNNRKHIIPALQKYIELELAFAKADVGREKLYWLIKDNFEQTHKKPINTYIFRINWDDYGYKSTAYDKKRQGPPREDKYKMVWAPDLVQSDFKVAKANMIWCSDISYLQKFNNKWFLIHAVIDLYDLRIVHWELGMTRTKEDSINFLNNAIKKNKGIAPEIFHSDHGVEYANYSFKNTLEEYGILQSMAPKGKSIANRVIEYFFAVLKREKLYTIKLLDKNQEETASEVMDYINYYNNFRLQKNLQYKTPNQFGQGF